VASGSAITQEQIAARFASNLLKLRQRAGLTRRELAERAELPWREIGYFERGQRLPRADALIKLCGSLEVEADQLLEGVDWLWGEQVFTCQCIPACGQVDSTFDREPD
jgi:DNA-binding XRE family transcriptional regulator